SGQASADTNENTDQDQSHAHTNDQLNCRGAVGTQSDANADFTGTHCGGVRDHAVDTDNDENQSNGREDCREQKGEPRRGEIIQVDVVLERAGKSDRYTTVDAPDLPADFRQ